MKKINNYILVAALVATSFTFGCKKDETNTVTPANGSATISGIIKWDFNTANDTTSANAACGGCLSGAFGPDTYEALPSGIVLTATIDTKDLILNPGGGNYPTKEYRTTVDATTGAYSFTIDANEKPVTVTIKVNDFRHDLIGPAQSRKTTTTSTILTGNTVTATTVVNGDAKIIDAQFKN